jgi:hypothetical protein
MQTETLTRYTNQDGHRAVVLTISDDAPRPYALSDRPEPADRPGTTFVLDSYPTREEAVIAAELHAERCFTWGTYEVWHAYRAAGL